MTNSSSRRVKTKKLLFNSYNLNCAATLHLPTNATDKPLPAILMIHGWGGTQLVLVKDFISIFNNQGFAVMTFDYPGWGNSEGLPRNTINPWKRVNTAESALAYLKSRPEIDESNIILWGSSFGGGHVIDLAAEHPELKGAIAQVPMLDGRATVAAVPVRKLIRFSLDIAADLLNPFKTHYIPIVSEADGYSSMDKDGAIRAEVWVNQHLGGKYDNRVSAKSLLTMGFYRPFRSLRNIKIPTLLVGAKEDTVAPFIEKRIKRISPACVEIKTIDGNHFDPYFDPWFSQNIALQLGFIKRI